MFRIGICDDSEETRNIIHNFCEEELDNNGIEHDYVYFASGEEVIEYCKNKDNQRIDILFLDVEMSGISGIEVKNQIIKNDTVWRIVFVTGYEEKMSEAFSLKTLGYVLKPAAKKKIIKHLNAVIKELEEDVFIEIKGIDGGTKSVRLEDVTYLKAVGNYTEIYLHNSDDEDNEPILSTEKIGCFEKNNISPYIIRVHKSYMVNVVNIVDIKKYIRLRDTNENIPIGRKCKENIKRIYADYGKDKVFSRLC